jgi:uncharacterized protein YbjT (DUF2867 family)
MMTIKHILVTGGTGKTGRRIVERLVAYDVDVRVGSRSGQPAFDWNDQATWQPLLTGMDAVYIAYSPDLAVPSAPATIQTFSDMAVRLGVKRLVLLSGRGEEEAEHCERIIQASGIEWTVLRVGWFFQNFSESFLLDSVLTDTVYLPVDTVREPFIDAEDIADAAVAALTDDKHIGQLYELTGGRLLTFADAIAEISQATGREIRYVAIPADAYTAALEAAQLPPDTIWLTNYLFTTVLDGRNECLTDGVYRALGRQPRDFSDYVRATVATGVWDA